MFLNMGRALSVFGSPDHSRAAKMKRRKEEKKKRKRQRTYHERTGRAFFGDHEQTQDTEMAASRGPSLVVQRKERQEGLAKRQ